MHKTKGNKLIMMMMMRESLTSSLTSICKEPVKVASTHNQLQPNP